MFEFQLNIMGDNNKTLDGGSRCSGVAQSLQFASEVLDTQGISKKKWRSTIHKNKKKSGFI